MEWASHSSPSSSLLPGDGTPLLPPPPEHGGRVREEEEGRRVLSSVLLQSDEFAAQEEEEGSSFSTCMARDEFGGFGVCGLCSGSMGGCCVRGGRGVYGYVCV